MLLSKILRIILILWVVGLLLFAVNISYWGYWSRLSLSEWWLNVLLHYLERCIYSYYIIIGIWIAATIITTFCFIKRLRKRNKT
jgi:hypothetical protein